MSLKELFQDILKPKTRQYIYRVSMAVLALLAYAGYVEQSMVPQIASLILAVLALSLADVHVDIQSDGKDKDGGSYNDEESPTDGERKFPSRFDYRR